MSTFLSGSHCTDSPYNPVKGMNHRRIYVRGRLGVNPFFTRNRRYTGDEIRKIRRKPMILYLTALSFQAKVAVKLPYFLSVNSES